MTTNMSDTGTAKYSLNRTLEAINNRVHTVGTVVLLSGFCGFFVGWVRLATWHHAIESVQVLAGIVNYPPDNSFYIYHMKIWSLFIQICSVMLYGGLSERFVAYFISGLLAMVGFQALSLLAFAFCRNTLLSVAASWSNVFCLLSGGVQFGGSVSGDRGRGPLIANGRALKALPGDYCLRSYTLYPPASNARE